MKLVGDVCKKANPPGITAPRQKQSGFPIASPGGGWHGEAWIKRRSGLVRLGSCGNSPGAPRSLLRCAPRPAQICPFSLGAAGLCGLPSAWAPAGGVVTSMCRQQPKVERACRASPEICLAMPCLCVCSNSRRAIREAAPPPDVADVFLFLFQPSG